VSINVGPRGCYCYCLGWSRWVAGMPGAGVVARASRGRRPRQSLGLMLLINIASVLCVWLHAGSDAFSYCCSNTLIYALLHGVDLVSEVCHFILDCCHFALDLRFDFLLNHGKEFILHFFAKLS
jgi:hypothetical protein